MASKAPFKRGAWLTYTDPVTGALHDMRYVKLLSPSTPYYIVVERIDTGDRVTVHVRDVQCKSPTN